jgi:hypothetical protein
MNGQNNDNTLVVNIAGENIKVYAEEGTEYVMRMANYINYIINEFNQRKGPGIRQNIQLSYVALELCQALFKERDSKMSKSERNYEKMFHMEVFNHRKTQDQLAAAEKKLAEAEQELDEAKNELIECIKKYDAMLEDNETKAESS